MSADFLGPQQLYRMFDAEWKLLYVGISINALIRAQQHSKDKNWFLDVKHIEIEVHQSRAAVEAAEIKAISTEKPLWNIRHAPVRVEHEVSAGLLMSVEEHYYGLVRLEALDPYIFKVFQDMMGAHEEFIARLGPHHCRSPFWHRRPVSEHLAHRGGTWAQVVNSLVGPGRTTDDVGLGLHAEDIEWLHGAAWYVADRFLRENLPPCDGSCCTPAPGLF